MLFSKIIPLAAIFASGAWAQFDQAQCASGYDWVRSPFVSPNFGVGAELDFRLVLCRTRTRWVRIRALSVPCWMLHAVVLVSH